MSDHEWKGEGSEFTVDAAARRWRLAFHEPQAGLCWSDGRSVARLLGMDHLAAVGRRDEQAFTAASLVSLERHRDRVQATFAPPAWHGLNVRAAWQPTPGRDGFDLEIQLWTTSPGVFRRVEVVVNSSWSGRKPTTPRPKLFYVDPRDAAAAALSYDGREPAAVLSGLVTRPVQSSTPHGLGPFRFPIPGAPSDLKPCYVEMVQPNDCARRIVGEFVTEEVSPDQPFSTRYALFGYDLEKGVVLRGRLRGIEVPGTCGPDEIAGRYQAFLREPPPLGP